MSFDDLDVFFEIEEFAEIGNVTPAEGVEFDISGIFEDPSTVTGLGSDAVQFFTDNAQFFCKSQDAERVIERDTMLLNNVLYDVVEVRHDGTGIATLILSRSYQ